MVPFLSTIRWIASCGFLMPYLNPDMDGLVDILVLIDSFSWHLSINCSPLQRMDI